MEQPTRPLVADAWLRWFWLWDAYFGIGYVAVCALILDGDEPAAQKWGAVGVLTAMGVWYLAYGRRNIAVQESRGPWPGRIFVAGVLVLLVVAIGLVGTSSFVLFAACPLIFMCLELREAVPVAVVVNLLPALAALFHDGFGVLFSVMAPGSVLAVVFAVAVGTWIHRIVSQSQERAELIAELEHSREENTRLSREAGAVAERARLAAEIHDTLAQGFTSLVTLVQAAESELDRDTAKARRHLALAARTARENLTESRSLVAGLLPSALGTASLDQAIRRQLERLAEETSITATYRVDGDIVGLPTIVEVVLLRAVQESLTNVRKHAGACAVTISLVVDDATATLRVTDDGVGFDTDHACDGFGLRGMRTRAEQVGGTLTVHSGTNVGTTVALEVPR